MNQPTDSGHWEPKHPFDLVVAYEDVVTRNRAMKLHDHFARTLSDDFDVRCAWWKLAHLTDSTLSEQADEDAASADMIVISLKADTELPAAARLWMDSWAHRSDHHKCALVTLFAEAETHEVPAPLIQGLRHAARRARMDFFTNLTEGAGAAAQSTSGKIAKRATIVTPAALAILTQPVSAPRWGINES